MKAKETREDVCREATYLRIVLLRLIVEVHASRRDTVFRTL